VDCSRSVAPSETSSVQPSALSDPLPHVTSANDAGTPHLNLLQLCRAPIDEVLVAPTNHHLACDRELVVLLIPQWAVGGVAVIEH
jgi:hypothetical protein